MIDIAKIVEKELLTNPPKDIMKNNYKKRKNIINPFKSVPEGVIRSFAVNELQNNCKDDVNNNVNNNVKSKYKNKPKNYVSASTIKGGDVYSCTSKRRNRNYFPYTLNTPEACKDIAKMNIQIIFEDA